MKELIYLIKQIYRLIDELQLYLLQNYPETYYNRETAETFRKKLDLIRERTGRLNEIAEAQEWDRNSNRKFQYANFFMMLLPTLVGIFIIVWGTNSILEDKKIKNQLTKNITALTSQLKQCDSLQNEKDSLINKLRRKNREKLVSSVVNSVKSNTLNLNLSQISNKSSQQYFICYFDGDNDSLRLKNLNVDLLLIMNATSNGHYFISINDGSNSSLSNFQYVSADPSQSLAGNEQFGPGEIIILDFKKLKELDRVTLKFEKSSLKEEKDRTMKILFK